MTILLTAQIERLRLRELRRVVIGRAQAEQHFLPRRDLFSTDAQILCGHPRGQLHRAIVAQQFRYRRREERRFGPQLLHLLRVTQQSQQTIADQVRCRAVSCGQQERTVSQQFFFV